MKCLGKVAHLDSKNRAIVITKNKVEKNTKIFDSESNLVGRVVNIFGPVNEPYLAISAKKGLRITKLVGREVYRK
ncbi:MAG: Gar1/Naf1 family protein [Candidatus Poseidoniia archaeon]|jgi:rRNA processing protein Gar1|nr:Gar1/Naf1 family protein [Candidatus Poseidoniia archaeon]|tara:strand:- start:352 stop:576 length:225 start_codon:yes stop_codon:yes gene_type:complete